MANSVSDKNSAGSGDAAAADEKAVPAELASLAAGLMVKAAKGDGAISSAETNAMLEILCDHLGMRGAEAMEHLTTAMTGGEETERELRDLAAALSAADRAVAFSMMLRIVSADGRLDPGEHHAAVSAGKMLGLPVETIYSELESLKAAPGADT